MHTLIYWDDFIETYIKLKQRGLGFLYRKFSLKSNNRTISAFDPNFIHSNWWVLDEVKKRINKKITGDEKKSLETYLSTHYLSHCRALLSIGCGTGSHEIELARQNPQMHITAIDLSPKLIAVATQKSQEAHLDNLNFIAKDVASFDFSATAWDAIFFHSSLHHMINVEYVIQTLHRHLQTGALLIINEYTGPDRLYIPDEQYQMAKLIVKNYLPKKYRTIKGVRFLKNKVYRQGWLRMWISDPSECAQSTKILPVLDQYFECLELKPWGGNILVPVLKHIAHNFANDNDGYLSQLFELEDKFIQNHRSDYHFGVYVKR